MIQLLVTMLSGTITWHFTLQEGFFFTNNSEHVYFNCLVTGKDFYDGTLPTEVLFTV